MPTGTSLRRCRATAARYRREQLPDRLLVARLRVKGNWCEIVPALLTALPVLYHEHRAGRELSDAPNGRKRRWRVAILEEQVQLRRDRARVTRRRPRAPRASPTRRSGGRRQRGNTRLDAHCVARNDEASPTHIPDRHPEHAVQAAEHARSPLLVAVNDDLGVGPSAKAVTALLEFGTQLQGSCRSRR